MTAPDATPDALRLLVAEIERAMPGQNLIAPASLPDIWDRHVADSLQLLPLAPAAGRWLDIGTGAGFPGMVVAIARPCETVLAEPRRLRADFLAGVVAKLGLTDRVTVITAKVERMPPSPFAVISARAVASLDRLFAGALHLATPDTVWLLPKGRGARDELAEARKTWQGDFSLVPSTTDPEASIVVARRVQRRAKR